MAQHRQYRIAWKFAKVWNDWGWDARTSLWVCTRLRIERVAFTLNLSVSHFFPRKKFASEFLFAHSRVASREWANLDLRFAESSMKQIRLLLYSLTWIPFGFGHYRKNLPCRTNRPTKLLSHIIAGYLTGHKWISFAIRQADTRIGPFGMAKQNGRGTIIDLADSEVQILATTTTPATLISKSLTSTQGIVCSSFEVRSHFRS